VQDSAKLGGITGCAVLIGLSQAQSAQTKEEITSVHRTLHDTLTATNRLGSAQVLIGFREQLEVASSLNAPEHSLYHTAIQIINSSPRPPYETVRRAGIMIVNEAINRRMRQGELRQPEDILRNDAEIIKNSFLGRRSRR